MNIVVIFAGGSGQRMHTKDIPKQFLEMHGKPIIIYTLELFEKHPEIDAIVIACKEDWIEYLEKLLYKYRIEKVKKIVPGGDTGQMSIYNGLMAAQEVSKGEETSVYKGYKQDKIEMRGDRAEMSDFPLYLNTVAGGLDRRDQTIGGFSFVVKIYAVPVVEIIG